MTNDATPGPWTREREIFLGKLGEDPDRAVVEFHHEGRTIGYWFDCEWDGYSPNSKLIAAAPALLKALEGLIALTDWTDQPAEMSVIDARKNAARQAIAEATD